MNRVYQHGDELFVTFDATPRMRNLRTGLTITPRVPFKYLGEMPQVGQVWEAKGNGRIKHILGVEGMSVHIRIPEGRAGTVPVAVFIKNHVRKQVPNFHFSTGTPEPLNAKATDRRFTAAEVGTAVPEHMEGALTRMSAKQHTWERFKKYCMANVGAEKQVRDSVGLYMAPDGEVWRLFDATGETLRVLTDSNSVALAVTVNEFNVKYRALPLPGQLWAKGSRYVTVDRVEDGRVYYTDGSSGLRRFLNEYANVAFNPDVLVLDFAGIEQRVADFLTGAGKTVAMQQMLGRGFRPLCKPCHDSQKVEELARGYNFGKQGLKDFGAQVQRYGRMLRPTPTGKPDPVAMSVLSNPHHTEKQKAPFKPELLAHLNYGTIFKQLQKWSTQLSIVMASETDSAESKREKIRYIAKRIKQLAREV